MHGYANLLSFLYLFSLFLFSPPTLFLSSTFSLSSCSLSPLQQLLHSPSDFSEAADRLCAKVKRERDRLETGDHLCFLGSGREQEDQYVTMVVAKFLQKSTPYVSLARGGFLGELETCVPRHITVDGEKKFVTQGLVNAQDKI